MRDNQKVSLRGVGFISFKLNLMLKMRLSLIRASFPSAGEYYKACMWDTSDCSNRRPPGIITARAFISN